MRFISLVAALAIAAVLANSTGAGARPQSDAWMERASRNCNCG